MIYMDAFAIITLVTGRPHHEALRKFLDDRSDVQVGTSTIGFVEAVRNTSPYGHYPALSADLRHDYSEIKLTDPIRDLAEQIPGRIRAADAIHVASAIVLGDVLMTLVTYDRQMLETARKQGLPVASPGMDG